METADGRGPARHEGNDVSGSHDAPSRVVSRFEADLLRILHFVLRREPAALAGELIFKQRQRPKCLSRTTVGLVQDSLAKGCTQLLARASGWRRERHLRAGRVALGRLWERTPPEELGLAFSEHTLEFLVWITAENPAFENAPWPLPAVGKLTFGDQLLLFYAFGALCGTETGQKLPLPTALADQPLCRLAYPDAGTVPGTEEVVPDFLPWTVGVGACILEALQEELAARWLGVERRKSALADWRQVQAVGHAQERVLGAFFQAVEGAGRRDLVPFLLAALAELLPGGRQVQARDWMRALKEAGPRLADRAETHRAALMLPRQVERLWRWEQEARTVAFFEENYAASQLWKADWEHWDGEGLYRRAQVLLRQGEPFQPRGDEP
jgi:hypothetical protein